MYEGDVEYTLSNRLPYRQLVKVSRWAFSLINVVEKGSGAARSTRSMPN